MNNSDNLKPDSAASDVQEPVKDNNSTSGKILIAVIVSGVLYVGLSPFIGSLLVKNNEKTQIARAPEPAITQIHPLPSERVEIAQKAAQKSAKDAAILDRFKKNTAVLSQSTSAGSATSSAAKAEIDVSLKKITAMAIANDDVAGMAEVDRMLAANNALPSPDPQYTVSAAMLGTQMASHSGNLEKSKAYSDIALAASRKADDYKIAEIEAKYYALRGSKVDFERLNAVITQFEADYDARRVDNLKRLASELTAATVSLPAGSFFRLKATLLAAFADLASSGNGEAGIKAFERVKKNSEDAGDTAMARVCENEISIIKKTIAAK
jgi:hypothetical protein